MLRRYDFFLEIERAIVKFFIDWLLRTHALFKEAYLLVGQYFLTRGFTLLSINTNMLPSMLLCPLLYNGITIRFLFQQAYRK
jgi:hypothetical protein